MNVLFVRIICMKFRIYHKLGIVKNSKLSDFSWNSCHPSEERMVNGKYKVNMPAVHSTIDHGVKLRNVHLLSIARMPKTFVTSFCRKEGLAILKAPAVALDTAFKIMVGRLRRELLERVSGDSLSSPV